MTSARLRCTHGLSISVVPSASWVLLANSTVSSSALVTMPEEQIVTRSRLSWEVMSPQPPFSSPIRVEAGTRTSSKKVWLMLWLLRRWSGSIDNPGVSIGIQKSEMPLCFFTSGFVRAASQM